MSALALALVVGVAGLLALTRGGHEPAQPLETSAGPGPSATEAGVPIGYERSETGAVAAALHYDVVLHGPAVTAGQRQEILAVLAVDAAAAEALDRHITNVIGGDVPRDAHGRANAALRRVPTGYELRSYADGIARVAVLGVWVSALPDEGLRSGGVTVTELALLWHDDDWRVSAAETQWGDTVPLERLTEFAEVRHAP